MKSVSLSSTSEDNVQAQKIRAKRHVLCYKGLSHNPILVNQNKGMIPNEKHGIIIDAVAMPYFHRLARPEEREGSRTLAR